MAYIFNWSDAEFLLPASGEYVFTAWVLARDATNGFAEIGTSPAVSITFNYIKADESTNWGPGLPNTTVEVYDLGQIQGKDKTIVVEEEESVSEEEVLPDENVITSEGESGDVLLQEENDTLQEAGNSENVVPEGVADVQKNPSLLLWGSIGTAIVIIVWAVVVFMKRKKKS